MEDIKRYIPQIGFFLLICFSALLFFLFINKSTSFVGGQTQQEKLEMAREEENKEGVESSSDIVDISNDENLSVSTDSESNVSGTVVEEEYDWFSIELCDLTMYATSSVNIRKLPSVNHEKLGVLSYGDSVEVVGKCSNGWVRVLYNDSYAYISGNYLTEQEPDEIAVPEYSGFIVADGNVSSKWLFKLEANYIKVPENVRKNFENEGWKIICTTQHLGSIFFGDSSLSIQAVNTPFDKEIWVEAREAAMTSIVHEMGHYVDFKSSWASSSTEFSAIYSEELQSFKSIVSTHENNTSTSSEYFAEAYAISIEYPDLMMQYCPKTYEFVTRCGNAL